HAPVGEPIRMTSIETPVGCFGALFSAEGLRRLWFPGQTGDGVETQPECPRRVLELELNQYLEGDLERFTVPLDLRGTAFQREVWRRVVEIPYGQTRAYSEVAREMGRPLAARAVGAANGANPVPILV